MQVRVQQALGPVLALWLGGCGIGMAPPASGAAGAVEDIPQPTTVSIDAVPNRGVDGGPPDISLPSFDPNMWLSTRSRALDANAVPGIYRADGSRFDQRGPVVPDPRACDRCTGAPATPWESIARIDRAIDVWHANFIHLSLSSYPGPSTAQADPATGPRLSWRSALFDADYLASLVAIVNHIGHKRGTYVLLSLGEDESFTRDGKNLPTLDAPGNPGSQCAALQAAGTATTSCTWQLLAQVFAPYPYVLFGLAAAPAGAADGSDDVEVLARYEGLAQTVRNVEAVSGTPPHILVASGTRGGGRDLSYYAQTVGGNPVYHALAAAGGDHIAYAARPFAPAADFNALFVDTAQYLPILLSDFGPRASPAMTLGDSVSLLYLAAANRWPFAASSMAAGCDAAGDMLRYPDGAAGHCDGREDPQMTYTTWGSTFLVDLINLNP